jgi:hypothetical protein
VPSPSFAYLAVFAVLVGLCYAAICRPPSVRLCVTWVLVTAALIPLYGGATILLAEYRRSQDGRVAPGVVVERHRSSDPTDAPKRRRWRAGQAVASLVVAVGYQIPDAFARLIATGSTGTWVVEYRYDCGAAMCRGRDVVTERVWSELAVGQAVSVRPAGGHTDSARLDMNRPWPMVIAKLAVAGILLLGAALASERFGKRGPEYVTVPAVVTAVDPVDYGQAVRWRVQFAYFASDGTALESADEVIAAGVRPGDDCMAVYPPEHPHLGTLRLLPRA